ncbi:glycosyltransferase [Cohnella fermenti]|uniref:Glycosyltransferase n=1 Tax=Cohnella fermenti TaxID=2565925 RepID=A0A4S4BLN6_9BACL|nr:glycosyltransferase [Cohnella fermenti]THF73251.1 glycosyltransferase [Cohnella fermenti]
MNPFEERTLRPEDPPFHSFGPHSLLEPPGNVYGAEEISIGSGVLLRFGYWLNVCTPVTGERPKIVIGDGVHTGFGLRLSAANSIVLEANSGYGPNVYIADTDHEYRWIGLPVIRQGITRADGRVVVGEGSWIGSNAVIAGSIAIGKGCVVGANSIVTKDVPDYSVAVGSPARIMKLFDPDSLDWVRIRSGEQAEAVLRARSERPLLSIGIPTLNQASELKACLEALLPQIGASGLIEVCVFDDGSTDETPRVLAGFLADHPRLRVRRSASGSRLGAERSRLELIPFARGRFLMLLGAGDVFLPSTVQPLLYALLRMKDRPVVLLDQRREEEELEAGEGPEELQREASLQPGTAALLLNREALAKPAETGGPAGTGNGPMSWACRLLERDPRFGIFRGRRLRAAASAPPDSL